MNYRIIALLTVLFLAGCHMEHDHHDHDHHTDTVNEPVVESQLVIEIPTTVQEPIETDTLTVNGKPVALSGPRLRQGDTLQDVNLDKPNAYFDVVESTTISHYTGYKLIEVVPSLDTPVCTRQTKELESASALFPNTPILIISADTPFALKRFCGANNINNIHTLSDFRMNEFGNKNGFLMPEYGVLARAILIIDDAMKIHYIDYAEEVTDELDILNALAYLDNLLKQQ